MTPEQMLERSTHVFIGEIESHSFERWPFFRIPGETSPFWMILRRQVRVETVLRGADLPARVDLYEVFWTGGASGDWNATGNGRHYLFLARIEDGRYHVVRDWWRSIFEIESGSHTRLPMDDSHPFWERFALLGWWLQPDRSASFAARPRHPGVVLSLWREAKLRRGLLRHPDPRLRLEACRELVQMDWKQDECLDSLFPPDRVLIDPSLSRSYWGGFRPGRPHSAGETVREWEGTISSAQITDSDLDRLRLFTATNNRGLRERFCREFMRRFPDDKDNGCPADQPPPATIVTEDGDVPLHGAWPTP